MEFSCKLFILVLLLPIIARCSADSIYQECSKNFSIVSNNLLKDNINHVLSDLITKTTLYGFANSSDGIGPDTIYGLTRCRGDISRETCSSCILEATNKIQTICPSSAEARIWYEYCFVRYDSNNFLGQPDTSYTRRWYSSRIATHPADFEQAVEELMGQVKAAAATSENKFGRGERNLLKSNMTIYGMAQCTRDLQESACNQCLDKALEAILGIYKYHLGVYVISTSCVMRYEINPFLLDPIAPSPYVREKEEFSCWRRQEELESWTESGQALQEDDHLLFILVLLLPIIARCSADSISQECSKNFSIVSNNLLKDNINHVLSDLITKTTLYGFANSSDGIGPDTIYGLTRCRGDISRETCSSCILEATNKIQTICPSSAEVRILYEYCFVRYDTNNFLGQPDTSHAQMWYSSRVATDPADFDQAVEGLMGQVKAEAATGESKFGRGERNLLKSNMTVYGMAQCTRDLQESACNQCLDKVSEIILGSCKYHLGCYVIATSCLMRYEINPFLLDPVAPTMEFSCKLFIFVLLLPIIARCNADSIYQECSKNITDNSNNLLQDNINHAFFGLIAATTYYGFATSSYGIGLDTIYGLTRCRGDISRLTCAACILEAANKIRTMCPSSAEARIWYEYCFIHYDSNNFLGQPDTSYTMRWYSSRVATDPADFNQAVEGLMGEVKVAAATRLDKFGRGVRNLLQSNMSIYGMAQCTRDLQESACKQCLEKASETIFGECKSHLGCYVINTSCVLRYEINDFLVGPAAPSPVAYAPTSP
ncbi:hypothetical protein IEQ34_016775 [Dendrobium chrysotoxum]|uniref:Gnk2-homologous domain-containing protein n=1 Tax=Dendrobium chrysotoxum TaxID=161865 RepID=A0AAV7GFI6_DENCH|nr:hypothetical protein IEQ34_016775 [Dendrobium chrysotoxum]